MKKFKRLISLVVTAMLVTAAATTVRAGDYDEAFQGLKFVSLGEYADGTLAAKNMRAFTVTPDGKYAFGGALNGSVPTVGKFDGTTGKYIASYAFSGEDGAYIKALSSDDRGYVYCGVANKANDGAVYFTILKASDLSEVSTVKIDISGKVGVNGITASKQGDKYMLYMMTNYDTDRLYCYDITDAANPKAVTTFGTDGYVDVAAKLGVSEGNNVAVASDGTIYLAANMGGGSKGDSLLKIKADGSAVVSKIALAEAYGCTLYDNAYVIASTYNGASSVIAVLNAGDLSTVASYPITDASNLPNAAIGGNKLYAGDQGYNGGDRILVSTAITFPAKAEAPAKTDSAASAATGDASIAAVAILMISAAGVVVFRKKH